MGMDIKGKSGNSFRANIWSWPAILQLVKELNDEQHLGLNLRNWDKNDGQGLQKKVDCIKLAKAIETRLKTTTVNFFRVEMEADPRRPEFILMMIAKVTKQKGVAFDQLSDIEEPIDVEMPRFFTYETDRNHVTEFSQFLRNCGGAFQIL